ARLEQPGWNTAEFDDAKWQPVMPRAAPSARIVAQAMQPIRNVEAIQTKAVAKLNDTTYVFDLGRNISGVIRGGDQQPAADPRRRQPHGLLHAQRRGAGGAGKIG
nr:hypothetical protein [Tanacetum cinerariifolium]